LLARSPDNNDESLYDCFPFCNGIAKITVGTDTSFLVTKEGALAPVMFWANVVAGMYPRAHSAVCHNQLMDDHQ
jgi:hypothetical protein